MKKPHKTCAYCFQNNKLTKEHIWPKGILNRLPTYKARFSEKAGKVMGGDLLIKDVCVKCNSGVLSELDDYGCQLFDRYFRFIAEPQSQLQIEYDLDNLSRWLAKIAYNTARSSSNPNLSLLQLLTSYILGQAARPSEFELYLDIVTRSMISTPCGPKEFPATAFRSTRVERVPPLPDWCVVRLVSINSFYFYILVFNNLYRDSDELSIVRRMIKGVILPSESTNLVLPPATTGAFEVHGDHMVSHLDKYQRFFRGEATRS